MKIGILTLPLHTNYGGNIQAYALMKVLRDMGHDVWLVNRRHNKVNLGKYCLFLIKRMFVKYFLHRRDVEIFVEKRKKREYPIISKNTQLFIDKYITPQTVPFFSSSELKSKINHYGFDVLIVGSDQVWRPGYVSEITDYFFGFSDNDKVRKISYAASFGTEDWEFSLKETQACSKYLQNFHSVSVREDTGIDLCRKHFGRDVSFVLDPTMLLKRSEYEVLIPHSDVDASDGELLVYLLDENEGKGEIVEYIESYLKLKSFRVNSKTENSSALLEERIAPPVEDWLKGFRNASFIISDSFHACVFSILFNKPFIAVGNPKRGLTRFVSLLKLFHLEDRMIFSKLDLSDAMLRTPINYDHVNEILEKERWKSLEFLVKSLDVNNTK